MHADSIHNSSDQTEPQAGRFNDWMATFIQNHPAACFFGALTLGYLVARVARRRH